jgi:hypothetical protein
MLDSHMVEGPTTFGEKSVAFSSGSDIVSCAWGAHFLIRRPNATLIQPRRIEMLRSRIIPVIGIAALVSGGTIGALAPSAGAAKTKTIKCTKLSGNAATKVQASGCTGNTGTKSKKMAATVLAGGGTIKWANGKTTTIGTPSLATGSLCPAGDTDVIASGAVTADTTGSTKPIPGVFNVEVCVSSTGAISLAPGTDLTAN